MTAQDIVLLAAACYGVSYILAYKGGPWGAVGRFRASINAPECAVCWGAWVAAALVAGRHVVPPAVYDAVILVAALSGVTTWLESKPFGAAVTTTLGTPMVTSSKAAEDCPSCEKAKRAREAAQARQAQTAPAPQVVTASRGTGWAAGVEAE